MRKIYVVVLALFAVFLSNGSLMAQNEQATGIKFVEIEGDLSFDFMSDNGVYLCGGQNGSLFVHNTLTGETTYIYEEGMEGAFCRALSNNGILAGSNGVDFSAPPAIWKNGEWTLLPILDGYTAGSAMTISADGSLLAGYISTGAVGIPCVWRLKGSEYVMELLPAPEKDWNDQETQNTVAFDMSSDGKTILGRVVDWTGMFNLPIVWTLGETGYTMKMFGEDILFNLGRTKPGPFPEYDEWITVPADSPEFNKQAEAFNAALTRYQELLTEYLTGSIIDCFWMTMSKNGRYITTTIQMEDPNAQSPWDPQLSIPCRFDLNEAEIPITTFDALKDAMGAYTTNNGLTLAIAPYQERTRTTYVIPTGSTAPAPLHEWLASTHKIDISNDLKFSYTMMDVQITDTIISGSSIINSAGTMIVSTLMSPENYATINYFVKLPDYTTGVQKAEAKSGDVYVSADKVLHVEAEAAYVTLSDLTGKIVFKHAMTEPSVSLASFKGGVYIVQTTVDGRTSTHKVNVPN